MSFFRILFVSLFIVCAPFLVSLAWAEGVLKVVDPHGLLRGYSKVEKSATVIIKLSVETAAAVTLINIDGLAGELSAVEKGSMEFQFKDVIPGTWKVSYIDPDAAVSDVTVVEE